MACLMASASPSVGLLQLHLRMRRAHLVDDLRQIVPEVPALRDEHRQHDDAFEALVDHLRRDVRQAGCGQLEKGKFDAQAWALARAPARRRAARERPIRDHANRGQTG